MPRGQLSKSLLQAGPGLRCRYEGSLTQSMVMLKKQRPNAWSLLCRMGKREQEDYPPEEMLRYSGQKQAGFESPLSAQCQTELKAFLEADQY